MVPHRRGRGSSVGAADARWRRGPGRRLYRTRRWHELLLVRVKAAAEKGATNAALEKLLAHAFGVAASQVRVLSGHKARQKVIHVAGDPQALRARLTTIEKSKNRR